MRERYRKSGERHAQPTVALHAHTFVYSNFPPGEEYF